MSKLNGISFMVRVRNEEKTLEESIRSLFSLTIPYEINIILHLCNDKSEEIAERLRSENNNIKIYKYNHEISRPGYELLATDADSIHSFVYYSDWCLKLSNYYWVFKWDADFISTPDLITFLNSNTWEEKNMLYNIRCSNNIESHVESYLACGLIKYTKYLFWEVGYYTSNIQSIKLENNISIFHKSNLLELKEYWRELPWYETEDSEEAKIVKYRIKKLIDEFGIEKEGMARGANDESTPILRQIYEKNIDYVNYFK